MNRGRRGETIYEKALMYAFTIFWFNIALARIFFYITDYIIEGTYTGDLSVIIETFGVVNYVLLYFYLYFFIYIFINVICLSVMFIWFSIKSKQEFQTISSVMTIGFTIFLIGWAFETIAIKDLDLIYSAIPSILVMSGALVALSPLIINLDFFSRKLANWIVIFSIGSILLFLGFTIFTNLPVIIIYLTIIWISGIVLAIVIIYIVINITKRLRARPLQEIEEKETVKDFLSMFTKPQIITEEQIEHFRKEKICIVCKSKIARLNYVCPKCDVLYCARCSKALTSLENSCWVCETPFDEVKPKLTEEDDITIV
ncbi:MAG: hypothetical protein ACFFBE_04875 [Promethearchaeota archaeon]